MRNDSRVNN